MEINPEYRHQTVSQSRVNDAVNGEKIPRIRRLCIQPWHQKYKKTNRWTDADWKSVPAGDLDTDMRFSNNRNFCQELVFAVKSLAAKHRTRGTWRDRDTWHALPLLTLTWELSRFAKQKQAGPRYWLRSPPRVGPAQVVTSAQPSTSQIYIPCCILSSGVMLLSQTQACMWWGHRVLQKLSRKRRKNYHLSPFNQSMIWVDNHYWLLNLLNS